MPTRAPRRTHPRMHPCMHACEHRDARDAGMDARRARRDAYISLPSHAFARRPTTDDRRSTQPPTRTRSRQTRTFPRKNISLFDGGPNETNHDQEDRASGVRVRAGRSTATMRVPSMAMIDREGDMIDRVRFRDDDDAPSSSSSCAPSSIVKDDDLQSGTRDAVWR